MRLGYEWVGWRNDSLAGHPVEMVFEFDSKRNFSSIIIHTNNMFSRDVQVSVYLGICISSRNVLFVFLIEKRCSCEPKSSLV